MIQRFAKIFATLIVVTTSVACSSTPASGTAPFSSEVNYEGLATVPSKAFDVAQVRPDTDFRGYTGLLLGAPELAFRLGDSAEREFPLSAEQKERFRQSLVAAFDAEFTRLRALELVSVPGPDTLTLDIRVEDIVVTVAPNSVGRAGRAAALLEASGAAVIIIELRDSQSNEILARGVHADSASGGAMQTRDRQMQTRFESAEKLVTKWAANARIGIDRLLDERR